MQKVSILKIIYTLKNFMKHPIFILENKLYKLTLTCLVVFSCMLYSQIPGVYKYHIPNKNKTLTSKLSKIGILPKEVYPNSILEYQGKQYFLFQKSRNSEIRSYRILNESIGYLVLCNDDFDEICSCKGGTFLFYKPKQILQRVEKSFSFSLKKNLIDRIKEFQSPIPPNIEEKTYCEILQLL